MIRVYLFALPAVFLLGSCVVEEEPPVTPEQYQNPVHLTCKLDGTQIRILDLQGRYSQDGLFSAYATPDNYQVISGGKFESWDQGRPVYRLTMQNYFNQEPTAEELEAMWSLGTHAFASDTAAIRAGAVVAFQDSLYTVWSSARGGQAGSIFTITRITPYADHRRFYEGTFSCKLYSNTGQVKTITDGSFVMLFGFQ